MARILYEGVHAAEFIVWETDSNFCRVNDHIPTTDAVKTGSAFLKLVDTGELVEVTAANIDLLDETMDDDEVVPAAAEFLGFNVHPVTSTDEEGTTSLAAFFHQGPAILNESLMAWPVGADAPETAALKAKLQAIMADRKVKFEA